MNSKIINITEINCTRWLYDLQPSGTINFSYINDFRIQLEYKDMVGTEKQQEKAVNGQWPNVNTDDLLITVYAINYNLLEIDQGKYEL